jgi:hypothetical protein
VTVDVHGHQDHAARRETLLRWLETTSAEEIAKALGSVTVTPAGSGRATSPREASTSWSSRARSRQSRRRRNWSPPERAGASSSLRYSEAWAGLLGSAEVVKLAWPERLSGQKVNGLTLALGELSVRRWLLLRANNLRLSRNRCGGGAGCLLALRLFE